MFYKTNQPWPYSKLSLKGYGYKAQKEKRDSAND